MKTRTTPLPCAPAPIRAGRELQRRAFIKGVLAGTGVLAAGSPLAIADTVLSEKGGPAYRGPNVILIRYGGGARRRESIDPDHTYSPFLCHDLIKRGTLFSRMEIARIKDLNTSHGEGTLNIVTGRYDRYKDIAGKFLGARFEPKVPTVFEYLRKSFAVPPHQTLIVNGEDRPDEEFYTFSNHFAYGINFRSNMLSLYRFKALAHAPADRRRQTERQGNRKAAQGTRQMGEGGLPHEGRRSPGARTRSLLAALARVLWRFRFGEPAG